MTDLTDCRWELLDFRSGEGIDRVVAQTRAIAPAKGLGARFYDIEWKLGPARDWVNIRPYVLRGESAALGFAPFMRRPRPLVFHFGEIAVASVKLARYCLIGDIYFDATQSRESQVRASAALVSEMSASLKSSEAIFFEGLPTDGPTYEALTEGAKYGLQIITIPIGNPYDHQFISLPDTLEAYLQEMGSRSRQSVQYSARKLKRDMQDAVQVLKFDTVEGVDKFLVDASTISAKTYQTNLLGLGIHNNESTRKMLMFAAERGWLRSYILYCRDVPCAFMLGHHYGGCFYYDDVGYDPEFAKWSVGSVLQLHVLEELINSPARPTHFDFSTGFGSHKGRFGNIARTEANVLVLKKTLRNRVLANLYAGSARLSNGVVGVLDRLGVKDRLKKLIRRSTGK